MGCCCRLLLALLLLPAGLGNDSTASPLAPTGLPFPSERIPVGPGSRDDDVSTPASGQPSLSVSTGPARDGASSGLAERDGHNATPTAALSPAPASVNVSSTTAATITTADSPPVASDPSLVPPTLETAPGLWTANTATLARGTMDLGAAASPTAIPASSSSLPTSDLYSSGTVLSPTPVLTSPSTTQPPALTKEFPSLGTLAMASSLAVEPTSPPVTVTDPTTAEATATGTKTTLSTGITMEEVPRALSAGSIVAITVTVIVVVVLVFGAAAYLKIRHSSYGRLLDDHDYGSWGNYNNPLYDDS
ncbi:prostate androgen-regulated mucin-like protein 1 [Alca torda]